jgi:type III restriction enzyme
VDLGHEAIRAKYRDKILYDYSLRQFREDGYSKDIELRQADLPPEARMMQAMVLSQYRRKVAEAHGLHCKPVILMKSKTIKESGDNEAVEQGACVARLQAGGLWQGRSGLCHGREHLFPFHQSPGVLPPTIWRITVYHLRNLSGRCNSFSTRTAR